jgi:hypothetical protein
VESHSASVKSAALAAGPVTKVEIFHPLHLRLGPPYLYFLGRGIKVQAIFLILRRMDSPRMKMESATMPKLVREKNLPEKLLDA